MFVRADLYGMGNSQVEGRDSRIAVGLWDGNDRCRFALVLNIRGRVPGNENDELTKRLV
jgi:hypothetical protein